jgi:NAD-dependent deacetylase
MEKRKKILIFTGADVSAESGIETFRSGPGGLWNNYRIEDVATPQGWEKDKQKVLEFYNQRRKQLKEVYPNDAHKIIAELEKHFDITVVTQNVDNLHERAGSTNVLHLHGELNKVRSTLDPNLVYDCEEDLNVGDKCEKGSQLRPHIIWFYEDLDPIVLSKVKDITHETDICIIVGTSMQVSPANQIPFMTRESTLIYYVDPSEIDFYVPHFRRVFFYHIQDIASTGMEKIRQDLFNIYKIE